MKPLFWKRIQLNAAEGEKSTTVWAMLEEPTINVSDFAEMFAKAERKAEGKLVSSKSTNKVKQQVVHLLDNKRSQAVGIFLRSLHAEMDEIQDALYNVNTAILDQESLRSLFEIVSICTFYCICLSAAMVIWIRVVFENVLRTSNCSFNADATICSCSFFFMQFLSDWQCGLAVIVRSIIHSGVLAVAAAVNRKRCQVGAFVITRFIVALSIEGSTEPTCEC